jgi:hypothetical protein
LPENIQFRMVKDKGLMPFPVDPKDGKKPEAVPPWLPGNGPWLPGNQKEKAAVPQKK